MTDIMQIANQSEVERLDRLMHERLSEFKRHRKAGNEKQVLRLLKLFRNAQEEYFEALGRKRDYDQFLDLMKDAEKKLPSARYQAVKKMIYKYEEQSGVWR
jgi:hypothetical protein